MEYRTLFRNLHRRPGLYGLDGSYAQFCVFIDGVDYGNDRGLLTGFREWLVLRAGKGDNLIWRALVLHLALPGEAQPSREPSDGPEANEIAVDTLFALLDEFLGWREEPRKLIEVFDQYLTWRRAQSWYR
jgi:hypothetical protein